MSPPASKADNIHVDTHTDGPQPASKGVMCIVITGATVFYSYFICILLYIAEKAYGEQI